MTRPADTHFWPVDKLILAYFFASGLLVLGFWKQLPQAPGLLAWHILGSAVIVLEVKRPNLTTWLFRNWYPVPFVGYFYKEMALLIPAVRHSDSDRWLADLDFRIWHANPCVWLERIQTPALTEFEQLAYTLFLPAVILVAVLLWRKGRFTEFQYYAFLIAAGYLVSYIGYIFVPARGPRFLLRGLQHIPLQGLWLFRGMQDTLDKLESYHYDCFPSGHTELTLLALWGSRMVSKRWFKVYLAYTPFLIFATVYLRYHYTVDLAAGAIAAFVLAVASPGLYKKLSQGARRLAGIEIVAAGNKKALKQFVELPYTLHRNDPYWVPPLRIAVNELLDRAKHPYYLNADAEFFLAFREGEVVGRVAAIYDKAHNRFHEENAGFFGFFECINDPAVAESLLQRARQWVFERGATVIRGPVNPSTNYECGMLIEGFDSDPMVMMAYNPRYYPALMDQVGLRKAKDLYAYSSNAGTVDIQKIFRVADRVLGTNGVAVRPINMKDFDADVARVWEVYDAAWARNWGFVPMSKEEFFLMGKEMKQILKPELVLIGEVGGRVVGFALALPDINQALKPARGRLLPTGLLKILYYQRLIKSVRVLALGVVEEYRTSGLAAGFYATLVRNARKLGYGDCEMSWILEDNVLMNRSLEVMGAKRYKTYRIYEWN
ncbi:MAG TPA: phosphatase PAP2 family protein [Bryobacteraceae bacterium]|nr:phosphatase PAP2 family protein [Bryobacteraceae bacterium]